MLELGEGFIERRTELGVSQAHVAEAAAMDRFRYGRIERGQLAATVVELDRIAAVLGLELLVRLYPEGRQCATPPRQGGSAASSRTRERP